MRIDPELLYFLLGLVILVQISFPILIILLLYKIYRAIKQRDPRERE